MNFCMEAALVEAHYDSIKDLMILRMTLTAPENTTCGFYIQMSLESYQVFTEGLRAVRALNEQDTAYTKAEDRTVRLS